MDKFDLKNLLLKPKTSSGSDGSAKKDELLKNILLGNKAAENVGRPAESPVTSASLGFAPAAPRPPAPPRSPSPNTSRRFLRLPLPAAKLVLPQKLPDCDVLPALPVAKVPHLVSGPGSFIAVDANYISYQVRGNKALIKDFVEEIQDIALAPASIVDKPSSYLLQLHANNFSLTLVSFHTDSQQWTFDDVLKISDHPFDFCRAKWASKNDMFAVSTDRTLFLSTVAMLQGLSGLSGLDITDLTNFFQINLPDESAASITDFSFSPDASVVAVCTDECEVYFYKTNDGTLLRSFEPNVFDETVGIDSIMLCGADPRNVQYVGPALLVLGFKGGNHIAIVNTLTFEMVYEIQFPSPFKSKRVRMDFDENLNVLVLGSEARSSLICLAVRTPVSFLGTNSDNQNSGLTFADLLGNRRSFDSFESVDFDFYSELPVSDGPVLSFVLLSTPDDSEPLSVYCVQQTSIQQYILPSETIKAPSSSSVAILKAESVARNGASPKTPSSPGLMKKRQPSSDVSFAMLNAGVVTSPDFNFPEGNAHQLEGGVASPAFETATEEGMRKRVSFSNLSLAVSGDTAAAKKSSQSGSSTPVTFDDSVDVVGDSSASVPQVTEILGGAGHATIVVDEFEKKRRDSDAVLTDEVYLFRNLVHEIHKMEGKISENVASSVPSMVEAALKSQLSGLGKSIEERLAKTMASQTERVAERVVPKVLAKPQIANACAKSVTESVTPAVEKMFKEMFRTVFMPSMQKAVSAMFSQIHESLEKGFAQSFAKNGGNGGSSRDSGALLKSLEERVVATAKASEQNMQLMFSKTTQEIGANIREEVRRVVAQEINSALVANGGAGSGIPLLKTPSTPVLPELDYKLALETDLENNDYEGAFTKALGTSDLSSVVYVCSKVAHRQVFTQDGETLLSQPVILSIIHQLSMDLYDKATQLKLSWIQECLMNLDASHPSIVQYSIKVLRTVSKRVDELLSGISNGDITMDQQKMVAIVKSGKMVSMCVRGMLQ